MRHEFSNDEWTAIKPMPPNKARGKTAASSWSLAYSRNEANKAFSARLA